MVDVQNWYVVDAVRFFFLCCAYLRSDGVPLVCPDLQHDFSTFHHGTDRFSPTFRVVNMTLNLMVRDPGG